MASIFKSARNAVASTFDTATDVVGTVGKTVNIGTTYIDNRAKKIALVDKEKVMLATAQQLAEIQSELNADKDVKKMFDVISETW